METRRKRVPAMAPEERRAALIRVTADLVREHGAEVSTRQIAEAAGVAEGTIFGVFENKNQLVVLAVLHAVDPEPSLRDLAAIDRSAPLRERLETVCAVAIARFAQSSQLMGTLRKAFMHAGAGHGTEARGLEGLGDIRARMMADRERVQAAIAEVIEPDAASLRRSPSSAARLLLLLCGAHTFGPFGDPDGFDAHETVSLLLDGLLIRNDDHTMGDQASC